MFNKKQREKNVVWLMKTLVCFPLYMSLMLYLLYVRATLVYFSCLILLVFWNEKSSYIKRLMCIVWDHIATFCFWKLLVNIVKYILISYHTWSVMMLITHKRNLNCEWWHFKTVSSCTRICYCLSWFSLCLIFIIPVWWSFTVETLSCMLFIMQ